jgi:hypothetical protein
LGGKFQLDSSSVVDTESKSLIHYQTVFPSLSPNNIITSAVAADLASHPSVRGNNKSLGTVTGLINGCGAITASVGLLAVGPLQETFGWSSVWIFLMGCTFTGTALMGSKIKEELFPAVHGYSELED